MLSEPQFPYLSSFRGAWQKSQMRRFMKSMTDAEQGLVFAPTPSALNPTFTMSLSPSPISAIQSIRTKNNIM